MDETNSTYSSKWHTRSCRITTNDVIGCRIQTNSLFHTTILNWQALRVIFYKKKGLLAPCQRHRSRVWLPKGARQRSSKHVYKSTAFSKELMGEMGCQRQHSTKLVDIHSEIFIESVSNLCAFIYATPNDIICMAAPSTACHESCSSAKADRTHVYLMDMMGHNGFCLCACGHFGRMLGLKVRVYGGGFVETNSQIAHDHKVNMRPVGLGRNTIHCHGK